MIPDDDIERALDWLRNHAELVAQAKGERVYCEEFRKSLKAILASEANESSEVAKERQAYKHPKYLEHLEKLKAAVIEDEKNKALRVAAELKISAWQTQNANLRSMKI